MSTTTTRSGRPTPTNEPVELARYTISAGERAIYGQRVRGVVRLTDVPASGVGRRYLIERGLNCMAELRAIVDDYATQAARWDAVPAEPCCLETSPYTEALR